MIGWRQVPVDETSCGQLARESAPRISQLFIEAGDHVEGEAAFDRSLFVVRRRAERECGDDVFFPSMSCRTIVYKGMLTAPQLPQFYPDLRDLSLRSTFAIVHSRFSTNTAPSWELAQPLRMIAHNGEINTVRGNVNWMRAREAVLSSDAFGDDLADCLPLIDEGVSDSAAFDRAFELMVLGGRTPQHAMMMMIPASWEDRDDVPAELEGFYRYHSRLVEPWDGPAGIAFCDGHTLGAMLDRNGLRPGRWMITRDGWVCLGSESGIFTTTPNKIARMGRLEPAQLFVVDLETGLVRTDGEPELAVASAAPYGEWYAEGKLGVRQLPDPMATIQPVEPLLNRQLAFGYTQEDLRTLLAPLLRDGREPTGSMGNDVALAVFSDHRPVALQLLQAALRAGDEPGDRLGPRAVRDEPAHRHRPAGQPAERRAAGRQPRRARAADPHRLRARAAAPQPAQRAPQHDDRHHLVARRRRGRPRGRARADPRRRPSRRSRATRRCSSSATARRAPSGCRSRRCSPARPSTTP